MCLYMAFYRGGRTGEDGGALDWEGASIYYVITRDGERGEDNKVRAVA